MSTRPYVLYSSCTNFFRQVCIFFRQLQIFTCVRAGGLPREDPGSVPGGGGVPLHRAQHLPHLHPHDQAQATPPSRTRQGGGIIYIIYS